MFDGSKFWVDSISTEFEWYSVSASSFFLLMLNSSGYITAGGGYKSGQNLSTWAETEANKSSIPTLNPQAAARRRADQSWTKRKETSLSPPLPFNRLFCNRPSSSEIFKGQNNARCFNRQDKTHYFKKIWDRHFVRRFKKEEIICWDCICQTWFTWRFDEEFCIAVSNFSPHLGVHRIGLRVVLQGAIVP